MSEFSQPQGGHAFSTTHSFAVRNEVLVTPPRGTPWRGRVTGVWEHHLEILPLDEGFSPNILRVRLELCEHD